MVGKKQNCNIFLGNSTFNFVSEDPRIVIDVAPQITSSSVAYTFKGTILQTSLGIFVSK